MAPVEQSAAAEKRCPVSGKVGQCPMMVRTTRKANSVPPEAPVTPEVPPAAAPRPAPLADAGAHFGPPAALRERPGGVELPEEQDHSHGHDKDELHEALREGQLHLGSGGVTVRALKAFTRAVEIDASNEDALCGKIEALEKLGRLRGALKASALGLHRLPGSQRLREFSARLSDALGDEAEGIVAEALAGPVAGSAGGAPDVASDASTSEGGAGEESPGGCSASRSQATARRELETVKRQPRRSAALEAQLDRLDTPESLPFRRALKGELVCVYREFYETTSTKNVATSQYSKAEKKGLSIKDGHKHMPRPGSDEVELPEDFRQPVGTLTAAQLAGYTGQRLLVSVHGDIFDVSDRPDKYGPDGPYNSMAGHDITWAFWSGLDEEDEWDKYYDLFQAQPREEREKRMQGLMSWWAFYEQEYGSPVGRLDVYDREWELGPPPAVRELCVVM